MSLIPGPLLAFHAVATAGSVHAAAKQLLLTQAAVTHRIAGLESDLGATLFLRSRRGMQLTDSGLDLLKYCRQVLDLEGEVIAKLGGAGVASHVIIQGASSILRARVIPKTQQLMVDYPAVTFEFRINDQGEDVLALKRGEADFIVIPAEEVTAEVDSKRLKPERYVLVGPTGWAGRKLEELVASERIVDFNPSDQMTINFLANLGLKPRTDRHFVNNTDALATLVEAGIGYSVLATEFAEPLLEGKRLIRLGGNKHYDHAVALAWYPRRHMQPFFQSIIRQIK